MAITFTNAAATSTLNAIVTAMDSGAGAALVCFYAGSVPASAESALSSNPTLAVVALADPSATVTAKTLTCSGMPRTDTAADLSGDTTFFRIHISTNGTTPGIAVLQGTCGTSNADAILPTVTLAAGVAFQVTSLTLSFA